MQIIQEILINEDLRQAMCLR